MIVDERGNAQIRTEARAWFLRLVLNDDAKDIADWEDWLAGDPARAAAYDRIVHAWNLSRHADAISAKQPAIANDGLGASRPAWYKSQARIFAVAASLAAIVGVGGLAYRSGFSPAPAVPSVVATRNFATGKGQHQTAELNDGSQIALGSATEVAVNLTPTSRNVSLRSGQIFVNVAKDHKRAFTVDTPFSSVTAVGTAFDVDLLEAGFTLSVLHGTVLVRSPAPTGSVNGRSVLVRAGQRVAVTRDSLTPLAWIALSGATPAWMTGRLEYRDVPLRSVVQDVNRYMTDGTVLVDRSAGELRYTGTVDVAHIRPWLAGVVQAFDLETKHDPGFIRIRKKLTS